MTYSQVLKKSLSVTTTQSGLWALGIFLSSGFNLHWWYLLSWLKDNGFINQSYTGLFNSHPFYVGTLMSVAVAVGLVVIIFFKLWFFLKVHSSLHITNKEQCFLCRRVKQELQDNTLKLILNLLSRRARLWRTYLTSLITIALTTAVLSLFNYYEFQWGENFLKSLLLVVCFVIALVTVSLWNMLTVLFIFWYELSFARASNLAVAVLIKKVRKIAGLTVILTFIFVFAVSFGSLIIWEFPQVMSTWPVLEHSFNSQDWQGLFSVVAIVIFLAWLVINNIFFNVAMIVLFDSLIKPIDGQDHDFILRYQGFLAQINDPGAVSSVGRASH